jgi:hypothetical protein
VTGMWVGDLYVIIVCGLAHFELRLCLMVQLCSSFSIPVLFRASAYTQRASPKRSLHHDREENRNQNQDVNR